MSDKTASWPNDQGFDNDYEQHSPVPLIVKGEIPYYAAGVLYRTGPLGYKIKTDSGSIWAANHWFDGLSCVHRFQIDVSEDSRVRVTYQSRRTVDEYLEMVKKTGTLDSLTFGRKRDPCKSFFAKVMTMFTTARNAKNVGVTLSINMPGGGYVASTEKPLVNGHSISNGVDTLHVKTDASLFKKIDPETLEPEGVAHQASLHPDLKGPLSASHAKTDPETGDLLNFNLNLGYNPTYRVFKISASTGQTSILATFPGKAAYVHSLFLTRSYVILCVWNSYIAWGGLPVLYNKNIVDAISLFDPTQKTTWYVIDRHHGKGVVATYESDPFFSFHTINAWEEESSSDPDKTDIVAELVTYDNTDCIHRFFYDNLLSSNENNPYAGKKRESCMPNHAQYCLSSVGSTQDPLPAELVHKADKYISMELPTINPTYLTRKHRYTYGTTDRLKSSFMDGIVKFDNKTQTATIWEQDAHTPGEAIFIADPNGKAEDEGVLLSVVLDGISGKSYLLCLDARDLSETGRAEMDGAMAFGFHGAFKASGRRYDGDI